MGFANQPEEESEPKNPELIIANNMSEVAEKDSEATNWKCRRKLETKDVITKYSNMKEPILHQPTQERPEIVFKNLVILKLNFQIGFLPLKQEIWTLLGLLQKNQKITTEFKWIYI